MVKYYIDSCIWLNLFKKEGDPTKGDPYWKIAEDFLNKAADSDDCHVIYSSVVLREIQYRLRSERMFRKKKKTMKRFCAIELRKEDKQKARVLESESQFNISFYDCIHIAICIRIDAVLVTRDKDLIKFASNHVRADRPEKLLN